MNRKIVLLGCASILLLSFVGVGFEIIEPVRDVTTWTVDDDGPADFSLIQEAIDAASPRDTIYVQAGTYYENIVVDEQVSIIGAGPEITTITAANSSNHAINVISNNVNIRSFKITGANSYGLWSDASGIYLKEARYCNFSDNHVTNNIYGIRLEFSSNITLTTNSVDTCLFVGISLSESSGCIIANNNLSSNRHYGICLWAFSDNNTVANNIALKHDTSNFSAGIVLGYSDFNVITNNTVSYNSNGIEIQETSDNNIIFGNTVSSNTEYGINLGFANVSYNNQVYCNNIIGNTVQAYDPGFNIWDNGYPSGGNYWSDHNPPDEDFDKIGDLPYVIDENDVDRYPLIYPYGFVPDTDINRDEVVNILDISTVAMAFGCKPADPYWNPTVDMDTNETINILDISIVAMDYGKIV